MGRRFVNLNAFILNRAIRRGRLAFTLIELLTVVAVVAVLASLLLPVLSRAKFKARGVHCVSNLKQWGLAINMYAMDHADLLPAGSSLDGADLPIVVPLETIPQLHPYGLNSDMWFCPVKNENRVRYLDSYNQPVLELYQDLRERERFHLVLEYAWWIPHKGHRRMWTPTVDNKGDRGHSDGWPTRLDDPRGRLQPILTDSAFGNHANPMDNAWPDWGHEDRPILHAPEDMGHAYNQKVVSVNHLYLDTHVESRPLAELKARHQPHDRIHGFDVKHWYY